MCSTRLRASRRRGWRSPFFASRGERSHASEDSRHQCRRPLRRAAARRRRLHDRRIRAGLRRRRLSARAGRDAARAGLSRHHPDPLRHGRGTRTTMCRCSSRPMAIRPTGEAEHGQADDPQPRSASSSTARTWRCRRSRRTRRCSTICGFAARCAAPRKAARKAIAAPARCWSAGCRAAGSSTRASMPASASSARSTAAMS